MAIAALGFALFLGLAHHQGWSKTYGGTDNDAAFSVVQTSDGGYALAGYTNSSGAGHNDFWLVKTDSNGSAVWNRTYGGTNDEFGSSVVQTSEGGYALAGYTSSFGFGESDFWLVKTDANGIVQWDKIYGGTGADSASVVIRTTDGGYALVGYTNSFGAGRSDFWLVKTDASGNVQWNKTYGGDGTDVAYSLVQTSDGGYALAGYTNSSGAGGNDFWLVKTDASGNAVWNRTCGGTNEDIAYSLIQTSEGGYALAGTTILNVTGPNFCLVKTDANGEVLWNITYGGTSYDIARSVIQTDDGGYALAGYTSSFGAGSYDSWLIKTDVNGTVQWNRTHGEIGNDYTLCVIRTSDEGYALGGMTTSGAGAYDFWLVKTDKSGNI